MKAAHSTRHLPAYLGYVESIVRCSPEHLVACLRSTGAHETDGLDADLRWPGYVGSSFDEAAVRVLCVAQVHHGPILVETGQAIQTILRSIKADGASPETADNLASAYELALPSWGPWKRFIKVLRDIDPAIAKPAAVAYVNIAKCWQDPRPPKNENCRPAMRACQEFYPLERLRATIDADVVLVQSSTSTLSWCGVPMDEGLFCFPGRPSNLELAKVASDARAYLERSR